MPEIFASCCGILTVVDSANPNSGLLPEGYPVPSFIFQTQGGVPLAGQTAGYQTLGQQPVDSLSNGDYIVGLAPDGNGGFINVIIPAADFGGGGGSGITAHAFTGDDTNTYSSVPAGKTVDIISMGGQSYTADFFTQTGTTITLTMPGATFSGAVVLLLS